MRQRVPESTIEWLASVNTPDLVIPRNLAFDLLDARKERDEAREVAVWLWHNLDHRDREYIPPWVAGLVRAARAAGEEKT
jgi:hypothetical protein